MALARSVAYILDPSVPGGDTVKEAITKNSNCIDVDIIAAGNSSWVFLDDTQTLTNKTLTSPTINGGTITGITDLAVADGGTGASTADAALDNLGGTTVGKSVFAATDEEEARSAIGIVNAAYKNKIINGDFLNFQRDPFPMTASGYGFDRWFFGVAGGAVVQHTKQLMTPGTLQFGDRDAERFSRVEITNSGNADSGAVYHYQAIEDVRTFAGQEVSISLYGNAGETVAIELLQDFGSGGSTQVSLPAGQVTLDSWGRASVTVTIPSISGKTIGADSHLGLVVWYSAGTDYATRASGLGAQTGTFEITGVQVESGVLTEFEDTGEDRGFARCLRYLTPLSVLWSVYVSGAPEIRYTSSLPTPLRVSNPTQVTTQTPTLQNVNSWVIVPISTTEFYVGISPIGTGYTSINTWKGFLDAEII